MTISFRRLDFFATIFGFTFDESVRLQTQCGGILSVSFAIISIVIVSIMGSSFFDTTNPIIVQNVIKSTSSSTITFGNRFSIAVRMTYGNQTLFQNLDKVRIKLVLNYVYNSNYNNVTLTEIPLSVCSKDKFPFQYQNQFDQYTLNESLCPDLTNQFVTGDFLSENMQYLQVQFQLCENDPITGKSNDGANIICKNSSEIQNFLEQNLVKAHLFYTDTYYLETNYTNPEIKYVDNYNINVYFSTQRETHFYLSNSNLTSDDTYFFFATSSRQFSNIEYSLLSERAAFREPQMNNFVMINIRSDKTTHINKRNYIGFVEIITTIAAVLNIVYIIFNFAVFVFSRIDFFDNIIKNSTCLKKNHNNDLNENLTVNKSSNGKKKKIIKDNINKGTVIQVLNPISIIDQSNDHKANISEIKQVNMTNEPIEFLSINKTNKSLISNNNPQSIIKLKQNHRHFDKVSLINYNHNKSLLEIKLLGFVLVLVFVIRKLIET